MAATLYAPGGAPDFRLNKILVAAACAGVPLTVVTGDAAAKAAAELSPFDVPPVLVLPSGGAVPRSNAILRVLAGLKADAALGGFTAFEEASVEQWLDWAFFTLEPLAMLLTVPAVTAALPPAAAGPAKAAAASKLGPVLAALESALASRTFLATHAVSLADIAVATVVAALWDAPGVLDAASKAGLPAVQRWLLTCRHQAPFASVLGAPGSSPSAGSGAGKGAGALPSAPAVPTAAPVTAAATAGGGLGLPSALTAVTTVLPAQKFGRARTRVADLLLRECGRGVCGTPQGRSLPAGGL